MIADNERPVESEIRQFHESELNRVKSLNKLRHVERDGLSFTVSGSQVCRMKHNIGALNAATEQIFAAVADVREMRSRPLGEIRARIVAYRAQFENLELDTLEVEENYPYCKPTERTMRKWEYPCDEAE